MTAAAGELARALAGGGVRATFGVPGSGTSYALITALQDLGVPFYGASHEGAAAIMAGAFGRQSGTVGCSVAIKGPGLANLLPGIVSNHFERWPTISVSEAIGPATPVGRVHKRLDHRRMLSRVVKAHGTSGDTGDPVPRLLQCARAEIPGPVHLDLAGADNPAVDEYAPVAPDGPSPVTAWPDVQARVAGAARIALIVGSLARRLDLGDQLNALHVPVFTTLSAKGIVDERSPHAAGVFTGDGKTLSPERVVLPDADLVVGLGLRNYEVLNPSAIGSPLVIVDSVDCGHQGFRAVAVHSAATTAEFRGLLDSIGQRTWGLDRVAGAQGTLRRQLLAHPWLPGRLLARLEEVAPDAVLVADTGSFCTVAEHVWRARDPDGFLCSANGRFMGTAVPMAIGATLASPNRPVVCATGDGGVRMYFAELKLVVEHRLSILFLFLSDGRYGSVAAAIPEARRRASVLGMARPSWFEAAAAVGCPAAVVEDLSALDEEVRRWRVHGGPRFVEARFEPEVYAAMTAEVR